jgi:glycosyltransferase involved in cell wall biosynthesis
LEWAVAAAVPSVLENPNGHIRNFRAVYARETRRWGGLVFLGHPTRRMVQRVEREYALADVIRVSSEWSKRSMIAFGASGEKVVVVPQRPPSDRFHPPLVRLPAAGPLRVCFVGSLDLRKGFAYLLRAARRFGPSRIVLRMVGGTGNRFTARMLARERLGLDVQVRPCDPLTALHWAELFVLPTLEDGSPFAVLEAMAAGLPLVLTAECGNSPLVRPGETGWVVPAADEARLAAVLEEAYARREDLARMGDAARADWARLRGEGNEPAMRRLLARARNSEASASCAS